MPDHSLKSVTPLGHDMPESVTVGPITIAEVTDIAMASVAARQGRIADVADAAQKIGVTLPEAGRHAAGTPCSAFWTGPEMWMVEAPFATHEDIVAALKPVFGDAASLTEQTDAWVRLRVSGADLPRLFERLCNVDLARSSAGDAIRTMIEHLGAFLLIRRPDEIDVISARSSAASLHHALAAAAKSAF
ncbi:sarcosine oxidase subunit gamma [Defluviimonas sp. WL0002]|uniref:Sarcosine oxidase subunit gamma n=1 Tax=Albidovulum marisflavi TaxID=2984159 RepID=A0ABT2Z8V3_9RHOB|nr:sarcosine oxidase subunit gamma [Defluviimonas sp. WL0002]MCV2867574.1 sarcosine oxidase subunit gamma [Defluviimonas sp. WL0002]